MGVGVAVGTVRETTFAGGAGVAEGVGVNGGTTGGATEMVAAGKCATTTAVTVGPKPVNSGDGVTAGAGTAVATSGGLARVTGAIR